MRRATSQGWSRWVTTMAVVVIAAGSMWAVAGVFEENWDSLGQGGDGINSFTMAPLFPVSDLITADGSRCQYSDPDNPDSNDPGRIECFPWDGSDWHVHLPFNSPEAKSFSGDGALHLGRHPNFADASFDDYTISQLSVAMSPPLALSTNANKKGQPDLTFWHIVALADDRTFNVGAGNTADRAIVQVALSDASGAILSTWQTIQASKNGYTNANATIFANCMLDPIDDGNTEDDLTTGPGVQPQLGPSSTCFPNLAFNFMGDWTSVDKADVGNAQSNFGRLGNMGTGVWVKSRFDLGAYAGQTVRIRFLHSGVDLARGFGWSDFFGNALGNATRGWMLDDVKVTGADTP